MIKIFKKILICFLVLLVTICSVPSVYLVKANNSDNKTMNIVLPSNDMSIFTMYGNYDINTIFAIEYILDTQRNNGIIYNFNGRPAISVVDNGDKSHYELYDGATEDDLIFVINEDVRVGSEESFGADVYEGYDQVKFSFGELNSEPFTDNCFIDLIDKNNSFELDFLSFYSLLICYNSLGAFFNIEQYDLYEDFNNNAYIMLYNNNVDIVATEDLIYELEADDYTTLNHYYGIHVTNENKIVLKFSNNDYDSDCYVVDFNNATYSNFYIYERAWNFFASKNLVKKGHQVSYFYDSDGKLLLTFNYIGNTLFNIVIPDDVVYEDNIVHHMEDNDEFRIALNDMLGIDFTDLIIAFRNPEFIEGADQEFDPSAEESLSFRLNIEYDKFLESGVVYFDGEIVDPENYEATEGSTIITFSDDFVNGLDFGDHNIKVVVKDGYASAAFKIIDEEHEEEEEDTPIVDSNTISPSDDIPETGDSIYLFYSLFILALSGLFITKKRLD